MRRLLLPLLALTVACVDKADTDDMDDGTDTEVDTEADTEVDDIDTEEHDVGVTVYVVDTDNQPIADATVRFDYGGAVVTDANGFAQGESAVMNDAVTFDVIAEGFTRHHAEVAAHRDDVARIVVLNPTESFTVSTVAGDAVHTTDSGFALRLDGGFLGDTRGNEPLTDVQISVYDTPERLASLPPPPPGYTVVSAADVLFTRDDEVLEFRGEATLTFPPPVDLDPARYCELEVFYIDENGESFKNGTDDRCSPRTLDPDTCVLTTNVCHLSTWALMLRARDEVCIDVDTTVDGIAPDHEVRASAVSACGDGVDTATTDADGTAQLCLPRCGEADQPVRLMTVDTRGDTPAIASTSGTVAMPPPDNVNGPVTAAFDLSITSADSDGFTAAEGDCDDTDPNVFPGADDPIDDAGLDSNCDGVDGVDADGDGFSSGVDCDDSDRTVHPRRTDNGLFGDADPGIDNDCDGHIDEDGDVDGDGFIAIGLGGTDCNDRNADIFPGAEDTEDGIDTNCDGLDGANPITDVDEDGFADGTDCNDADGTIFPGQSERCDGVDSDCDGQPNVSIDGVDSCLDGGVFDDGYTGQYTVHVLDDGVVVDRCSGEVQLSIEDGRQPSELELEGSSGGCVLTTAFGGADVTVQTVDATVAPFGLTHGTSVFTVGEVVHEGALDGFTRGGRISGQTLVDTEDEVLGAVTLHFIVGATRDSARTDALANDADFDGIEADDDCDDNDPTRRIGAVEACNGVDDNCNGEVDEAGCPAALAAPGEYVVTFDLLTHDGYGLSQPSPPPSVRLVVDDDEMSNVAAENPIFSAQSGPSMNVVQSMTVTPPPGDGSISGTLVLESVSGLPSGPLRWSGTVNEDGFSGIAVAYSPPLRRWTHVVLRAAPPREPTADDADFDGTPTDLDCDDNDPTRRFGVGEVCNGLDDDCDGLEDNPFDDVCPIMPWTGESFPITFSFLSDDGIERWTDTHETDVNFAEDGTLSMDNPVFTSTDGPAVNVVSMSMNPPDQNGGVTGTITIESSVEGIESGTTEWTGNIDTFTFSAYARIGSGPRWTHIAVTHRNE